MVWLKCAPATQAGHIREPKKPMTKRVELLFDFVSPNAYLMWQPLRSLVALHDARLEVTPVFLGGMHKLTGNAPPMVRDAPIKGKNDYAMLEIERFVARHSLTRYRINPAFPFNSITLQRMLSAAAAGGHAVELVDVLLPALWEEGCDPSDMAALGDAINAAGLDAADLLASAQTDRVKQALIEATDHAIERGAFGIPTVFVHDEEGRSEMFFGKERLGQIEEELAR